MSELMNLSEMILLDDVSGKQIQASYNGMCEKLRRAGRAIFLSQTGERVFLVLDSELNQLRDWDLDDQGKPRYNPIPRSGSGEG
jgi:hypothetical protein